MIKSLLIKNYALIEEITVEFSQGLMIITGETGAGKSIIVDAVSLILGARANTDAIRMGTEKAVVEAIFDISENRRVVALLKEQGLDAADELIVRREIASKGQSRSFLNDTPVQVSFQKEIGEWLVDLHGQHEHQSLLRVATHIEMVDEFGGLHSAVDDFRRSYDELADATAQLSDLRRKESELREKEEFYRFQIDEIDAVSPQRGEEEELEREHTLLENSEKLSSTTRNLYELLYEGDASVHDLLVRVRNELTSLVKIDPLFKESEEESGSATAIVRELAIFLQNYNSRIEFNAERLEEIRQRLGRLAHLRKKYGGSTDSVLDHRDTLGRDLALVENFDDTIRHVTEQVDQQRKKCATLARKLSTKRVEVAAQLESSIVRELRSLGLEYALFRIQVSHRLIEGADTGEMYVEEKGKRIVLHPRGYDDVEFYLSTNRGEELRPLSKTASGGEISRVMLALKSALAKADALPVLIFDEIDVGVSGRVAQAVGLALKNLAKSHQVIAITHLPQIAGLADMHYLVSKVDDGKRTTTHLLRLSRDEQVREVAKLMSGEEVTSAGIRGARELMNAGRGK